MPKAKFRAGRRSRAIPIVYKFKLGNRKSNISAHMLSTDELLKQYFAPRMPKDKPKIAAVLRLRNVEIGNLTEENVTTA